MFFMSLILLLFFYFSKKKIVEKELEKKNLELLHRQELIYATVETQEQERTRIARDLHDEISSKLNIVKLNTHLLTNPSIPSSELFEIRDTITSQVTKALESSRRIAHDLLPPVLDKFGLDAGLRELCGDCSNSALTVEYENDTFFDDNNKPVHLQVFRIVQELLNNSLKHSGATHITLRFEKEGNDTKCTYTDNGKGFNNKAPEAMKGLGTKNIESRVLFLGGNLMVDSAIGKGYKAIFTYNESI